MKLNQHVQNAIIAAVEIGASRAISAEAGGISERTLYYWLSRGNKAKSGAYFDFVQAYRAAESRGALHALQTINTAIKDGDWKASAWLLERRHSYKRDVHHARSSSIAEAEETKTPDTVAGVLEQQIKDLQQAIAASAKSESWQAYAALQRQLLNVIQQKRTIDDEDPAAAFAHMPEQQILQEVADMIFALPPVLRQQLLTDVAEIGKLKIIK